MINIYYVKNCKLKQYSNDFAKIAISKYLKIKKNDIQIKRDIYGKPYICNVPNVNLSVAHAKNAIVCAVTNKNIGIDLESIRSVKIDLVNRYYSKKEKEYVFSNSSDIEKRFTEIWTKKEAYLKYIGTGIMLPFSLFCTYDLLKIVYIRTFYIEEYICSVCYSNIKKQEKYKIISIS